MEWHECGGDYFGRTFPFYYRSKHLLYQMKKQKTPPSNLLPQQPLKEIKTITITLQRPHLPRPPILPPQLLRHQQPPIPGDPLHPRPHPALLLQRHNLVLMQPVPVIRLLQPLAPALPAELAIQRLKPRQDAREQPLRAKRRQPLCARQRIQRRRRRGVGHIDAHARHERVLGALVARIDEDAADLGEVGRILRVAGGERGGRRVQRVDVVGPLEAYGQRGVAGVVRVHALHGGERGEVLDEDDGGGLGQRDAVAQDGAVHERARRRDPDVGAAAAAGDLGGRGGGEAVWEAVEEGWILLQDGVGAGDDFAVEEEGAEGAVGVAGGGVVVREVGEEGVVVPVGGVLAGGAVGLVGDEALDDGVIVEDSIGSVAVSFVILSSARAGDDGGDGFGEGAHGP